MYQMTRKDKGTYLKQALDTTIAGDIIMSAHPIGGCVMSEARLVKTLISCLDKPAIPATKASTKNTKSTMAVNSRNAAKIRQPYPRDNSLLRFKAPR